MHEIVSDDFSNIKGMLDEIQLKLMGVDPVKQLQFLQPIKRMVFEAWQDACNPNDSFLYDKPTTHE